MDEPQLPPPPPLSKIALAQYIAILECYKRLAFAWCIVPILLMALPLSVAICCSVLEYVTRSAVTSISLTIASIVMALRFIRSYAPSEKAYYEGLQRQGLNVFLGLFVVSCLTTRYALAPLLHTMAKSIGEHRLSILHLLPTVTWWQLLNTSFRLAAGAAILGLAVVLRFIGPGSIVRCSTFPLAAHPLTVALRSAWAKCTSTDSLLNFIAGGPSETPGELFPSALWQKSGRRYQRPTFRASLAQILICVTLSSAFCYITVLRWYPTSGDSVSQAFLICPCLFTALFTVPLDGVSHEINPKRYSSAYWFSPHDTSLMLKSFVSAFVAAPACSFTILWLAWKDTPIHLPFLTVTSTILASLMSLYFTFLDLFTRRLLFTPGVDLQSLTDDYADEISLQSYLGVVVQSVSYLDKTLMESLIKCTDRRARLIDIEQDEVNRNKVAMERMAQVLLNQDPYVVEVSLEEDMLRFLILESIGGASLVASADQAGQLCDRHKQNLMAWIQPKLIDGMRSRYVDEPPVVPLVRVLCSMAGGLGEALNRVAMVAKTSSLHTSVIRFNWILPPGAVASGDFAITAAARLIVLSLNHTGTGISDWKSSHLSVLVMATLDAAFRLRSGVIKYASLRRKSATTTTTKGEDLADETEVTTPDGLPLLAASDQAAISILRTIKSFEGGRNIEFKLDSDCQRWIRQLLGKDL